MFATNDNEIIPWIRDYTHEHINLVGRAIIYILSNLFVRVKWMIAPLIGAKF